MDRGCAPCRILFLKRKSIWVLFLMTFLLAGLGTLFINFFFDSLNAWKKKKKGSKGGNICKSGRLIYQVIIFLLLVGIGIVKYATPIGNWASFTACIGIFFILQSLTKKYNSTEK